jgi:hypothetical protein
MLLARLLIERGRLQMLPDTYGGLLYRSLALADTCRYQHSRASARLMSDGTGRPAEFECHPDERVEAVRWLVCEAEVQQAIGRVRGVRRSR